jgi:3-hydroxyisobutyrate dehydrogenase
MKLAVLGTGLLGRAIAERLVSCGHSVSAYNRTGSKLEPLKARGCVVSQDPSDVMQGAEAILVVLADVVAIRQVLCSGRAKYLLAGRTIMQMGTIGSEDSRMLGEEIDALGGDYLEAPVLGSKAEALAGTLSIMVGGTPEHFTRWHALLADLGPSPRHIGPVGTAAVLKLALNQLIAAEITAFALSLGMVQGAGVSVEIFMEILRASAVYAPAFDKKLSRLLSRDYANPNFPTQHLLKDVNLVEVEAQAHGLTTAGLDGIRSLLERTIDAGWREADYSAVFEAVVPRGTGGKSSEG